MKKHLHISELPTSTKIKFEEEESEENNSSSEDVSIFITSFFLYMFFCYIDEFLL